MLPRRLHDLIICFKSFQATMCMPRPMKGCVTRLLRMVAMVYLTSACHTHPFIYIYGRISSSPSQHHLPRLPSPLFWPLFSPIVWSLPWSIVRPVFSLPSWLPLSPLLLPRVQLLLPPLRVYRHHVALSWERYRDVSDLLPSSVSSSGEALAYQLQIVVRVHVLCEVALGVDGVSRVSSLFFMLTWTYVFLYTRLSCHLFDVFLFVFVCNLSIGTIL